eukprot:CAMPEP_0119109534 /NCGR_PEP_ID=MMETSP1180-20130426/19695_1 /TAXON_ID=3052 ORGANISM="Chlamydomonas cf sp, Strain CCMP681" /NCGR_SAMPLE_ID=MMETSP1180 /ASSEMBLY_ACC=CAM_ASM_000741 /LENGTH=75 /DNA_ID=CAMNT_0007095343 /DNA_START=139 /DNA_END=366 /DNA_ORIENTATION=-
MCLHAAVVSDQPVPVNGQYRVVRDAAWVAEWNFATEAPIPIVEMVRVEDIEEHDVVHYNHQYWGAWGGAWALYVN